MNIRARLVELGIELPDPPKPPGHYRPCVVDGHRVETAGHLPLRDGAPGRRGKLGQEVDVEQGVEEAQVATLNTLATLQAELGSLDRVDRLHSLRVYVAATADFDQHHLISNGASDLLFSVFGDQAGGHVRTTIGVPSLPFDQTVEVELTVLMSSPST